MQLPHVSFASHVRVIGIVRTDLLTRGTGLPSSLEIIADEVLVSEDGHTWERALCSRCPNDSHESPGGASLRES